MKFLDELEMGYVRAAASKITGNGPSTRIDKKWLGQLIAERDRAKAMRMQLRKYLAACAEEKPLASADVILATVKDLLAIGDEDAE